MNLTETICSCDICVKMCEHPCWATPEEATKLIQAGYGNKLMNDYWVGDRFDNPNYDIQLLCPAEKGREGLTAKFFPINSCIFFNNNKCDLHNLGLKPLEGRIVDHQQKEEYKDLHKKIAMMWNNKEAQKIVEEWDKKNE